MNKATSREEMTMPHPRYTGEEVQRRAEQLYEKSIRQKVENEENIGKLLMIDIESGDYEIGDVGVVAAQRLRERHPNAAIWGMRIGYDAVYTFGGRFSLARD
jgi:hypothetical protein